MKIAVIGTGYWGKNHVRALNEMKGEGRIEDLYICDVDEERAKSLANGYGLQYFTDYKKLPGDVEGVVIATPSNTHYEIAKYFLEEGKDVLVEKPMTMNSKESQMLIEIAEKNGRILMVGHIFRYHTAVNEIKRRIKEGIFGRVYYIMSNRFSLRYPRNDSGVLLALGIHEVDIFCHLLDKNYPNEIYASVGRYIGNYEETAQIITYFDDGINGYAFESWITPVYGKRRELYVIGSKMSAFVDYLKPNEITYFESTITPDSVELSGSYTVPIEYKEPLKEELYDFIKCIESRDKPVADMFVGKRAVEMIEAAMKSAEEGRRVTII